MSEPREIDGSGYTYSGSDDSPWPTVTFEADGRNVRMKYNDGRTFERLGGDWVETTGDQLAHVAPKVWIDPSAIKVTFTRDEPGAKS